VHIVPSGAVGLEHAPVLGLHAPATWHGSLAAHTTGLLPVQTPAWQVSTRVHALPSLHDAPLLTLEYCAVLAPGWHVAHMFDPFVAPEATHAPPM
jgi:hypothetical protein